MDNQFQRLSKLGLKETPKKPDSDGWVRFGKTKWFEKTGNVDPRLERAFLSLCDSTAASYKSTLSLLDQWLNGRALTDELLADYLAGQFSRGFTLGHLNNVLSAVRFRAKALDERRPGGKVVKYTMDGLGKRSSGRGRGQAVPITIEQITHIVERTEKIGSLHALRDSALIATGFYVGLRRGELQNLQVEDLTLRRGHLGLLRVTRSKGDPMGKDPKVRPLSPEAGDRVLTWLETAGITDGPVFRRLGPPNMDGVARIYPRACSLVTINMIVKRRAEAVGLKGITSHSLRRSMAQDLSRRGFSTHEIAHAGRWSSLKMVSTYTKNERAARSVLARAYGPKEGLKAVDDVAV